MNLLLIITPYTPAQTPNTLRWTPLVEHFKQQGHKVVVLTTKRAGIPDTEVNSHGIKIYRAGHNTLYDFIQNLKPSQNGRRGELKSKTKSTKSNNHLFLEKIIDKTWRKYYWPDGSQLFLKPGTKKALEIINREAISHIVSVGLPFTTHWIAKSIKEKHKDIHWHMDIQDPFCYSKEFWVNNFDRYESKNIDAENLSFRLSDTISVTNPRAGQKYRDLFSSSAHKLTVIPPLFSAYTGITDSDIVYKEEKWHLGFFGTFYQGVRSPEHFLMFLSKMQDHNKELFAKIKIHFFGLQNKFSLPIFSRYSDLNDCLVFHGFVSRDQSISEMKKMNFLLNFGNTTDYHLPSKVVDYLYMNKPIINITSIDQDSTQAFFEDYDDIINLNLDKDNYDQNEQRLAQFLSKPRSARPTNSEQMLPYSTSAISKQYLDCLLT